MFFNDDNLVRKQNALLRQVRFGAAASSEVHLSPACSDQTQSTQSIVDIIVAFNMFVEDNLYASYRPFMYQMIVASVEALFALIESPTPLQRQCFLALDKFLNTVVLTNTYNLGFLLKHAL